MGKGEGGGRLSWQKVVATVYRKWYGRIISGVAKGAQRITPGCRLRSLRSLRPTWPLSRRLLIRRGRRGGQGFGLLANRLEPLVKDRGRCRIGVAPPPSASAGPVLRNGQVRQPKTLGEMRQRPPRSQQVLVHDYRCRCYPTHIWPIDL